MDEIVLDSSAIMAVLNEEPGTDTVLSTLDQAVAIINAVTLTEVVSKLADDGTDESAARSTMSDLRIRVVPFNEDQAYRAGMMRPVTRRYGLSLGDRACLALAQSAALPVLTADRMWADIPIDVEVHLIR